MIPDKSKDWANWRYKKLGNLPHVMIDQEYRLSNPGFVHDFQLIDVQNFNGVGESEPNPYFYQVSLLHTYPWLYLEHPNL
jgi:hypothetical protein